MNGVITYIKNFSDRSSKRVNQFVFLLRSFWVNTPTRTTTQTHTYKTSVTKITKIKNNYDKQKNKNFVNKKHLSIMQTKKPIKRVCVYVCCRSPCGGRRHNVCPQYQFGFGSSHGTYAKKIYQLKTFYKKKNSIFFC